MDKNMEKIDFVVFWVDGSDPKWRAEKEKWEKKLGVKSDSESVDISEDRYRDYGLLKYWFRGVEKFTPWVNKVHFITCGHLPEWLNVDCPKLHVVKHSDYLPEDVLPTFNSNAIETSVHKIKGLAEQFVLLNDDVFIINKIEPDYFFKDGKPVNMMSLRPIIASSKQPHYKTLMNIMEIINRNFDFKKTLQTSRKQYLSLKQGRYLLRTIPLLGYKEFPGFANYHGPNSYLKSTCEAVWDKEPDIMNRTMHNRFRNYENDVSDWIFNYWQFASGNFYQKSYRQEKNVPMDDPGASRIISSQKYKVVGLGDPKNPQNTDKVVAQIRESFEKILPKQSEFERDKA